MVGTANKGTYDRKRQEGTLELLSEVEATIRQLNEQWRKTRLGKVGVATVKEQGGATKLLEELTSCEDRLYSRASYYGLLAMDQLRAESIAQ